MPVQPASPDRVLATIRTHLALRDIDSERVTPDARFGIDLDIDSLDLQTLAQELEDEFGVYISERDAADLHTVGQTVVFVVEWAGVPAGRPR